MEGGGGGDDEGSVFLRLLAGFYTTLFICEVLKQQEIRLVVLRFKISPDDKHDSDLPIS